MNDNLYNPREYWGQPRKRHQAVQSLNPKELRNLLRIIRATKPPNILEVGSGWGRLYLALEQSDVNMSCYSMCDFTDLQRMMCYAMTGAEPDVWDGITLPYNDNSFPLVISFDVMLHVPPEDIMKFIAEHIRVSSRYLFIATTHKRPKRGQLAPHCFVHTYTCLFDYFDGVRIVRRPRYFRNRAHWLLEMPANAENITTVHDNSHSMLP